MIQFSSPAAAKVAMLQTHARRLLDIIGKPDAERGALAPEEIPAAYRPCAPRSRASGASRRSSRTKTTPSTAKTTKTSRYRSIWRGAPGR